MKYFFLIFAIFVSSHAMAEAQLISMIASNAVDAELPVGLLNGSSFRAIPDAKFVKLHLYSDKPLANVNRIDIKSCTEWAAAKYRLETAFINFDEVMGSRNEFDENDFVQIDRIEPNVLRLQSGANGTDGKEHLLPAIESLTINFGPNENICIKSLTFYDPKGKVIPVRAPIVVDGSMTASSVLTPVEAYSPENLFDSKFENAWATDKVRTGANVSFNFSSQVRIEKVKIWNGYQRSVIHCQQNSRVKVLNFTGDGGYSAEVSIEDKLGAQEVTLPKPFVGKNLIMTVKDSIKGKSYEDLVMTELRFFNGQEWFFISPLKHIQANNQKNREQFGKAKLEGMLNQEFVTMLEGDNWSFRFRADGSMFIKGYVYGDESGMAFSALGNYEIKSIKAGAIQLRVFGFLYKSKFEMDCNGCGVACNSPSKQGNVGQKIFQQNLTLKPTFSGGKLQSVEVVNETKPGKLEFKKLTISKAK